MGDGSKSPQLNDQQEAFCQHYIQCLNATKAAKRAGYSRNTAYSQGGRLLKHVEVAARIEFLKAERAAELKVDANWVLEQLVEMVRVDIGDFYGEDGELLAPHKLSPAAQRLITGIESSEDKQEGVTVGQIKKIRTESRLKAIELAGKHIGVGAFQERIKHEGAPVIIVRDYTGREHEKSD